MVHSSKFEISFVFALLCLVITLFPFSLNSIVVFAQQYITVPDDYDSIQAAIDAAMEGSTILVKPGTYFEHVRIVKPLRIIGCGNDTVIENNVGSKTVDIPRGVNDVFFANFLLNTSRSAFIGLYVGGQNCVIENITIINHEIGLCIYDSSNNTLRYNNIFNNSYNLKVWGLFLSHFLHNIDETNIVNGRRVYYLVNKAGVKVPSDAGYIGVINSTNITIENVNVTNNYSGILLAYTDNSILKNVTSSLNEEGLRLIFSNNITMSDSIFCLNNWSGISLIGSSNNTILNNTIYKNNNGLLLSYSTLCPLRSTSNWIYKNEICESTNAIYFDGALTNYVQGNIINMCSTAFYICESQNNLFSGNSVQNISQSVAYIVSSSNNRFYHNNFVNNHTNFYMQNSICNWSEEFFGGNYWGDGFYVDFNGDGIADEPYIIDDHNTDYFPLVYPVVAFCAFKRNEEIFAIDLTGNLTSSIYRCEPATDLIEFYANNSENGTILYKLSLLGLSEKTSPIRWSILTNILFTNCSIVSFQNFVVINVVGNISDRTSSLTVELIPEMPLTMFLPIFSLAYVITLVVLKKFNRKEAVCV